MSKAVKRKTRKARPESEVESVRQTGWRGHLAVLPGIGVALLPKLTCPACWPAYAGLLGSLGLGFADYAAYILPLTLLFWSSRSAPSVGAPIGGEVTGRLSWERLGR